MEAHGQEFLETYSTENQGVAIWAEESLECMHRKMHFLLKDGSRPGRDVAFVDVLKILVLMTHPSIKDMIHTARGE